MPKSHISKVNFMDIYYNNTPILTNMSFKERAKQSHKVIN